MGNRNRKKPKRKESRVNWIEVLVQFLTGLSTGIILLLSSIISSKGWGASPSHNKSIARMPICVNMDTVIIVIVAITAGFIGRGIYRKRRDGRCQ